MMCYLRKLCDQNMEKILVVLHITSHYTTLSVPREILTIYVEYIKMKKTGFFAFCRACLTYVHEEMKRGQL